MNTLSKSVASLAIAGLVAGLSVQVSADPVRRGGSPVTPDATQTIRVADLDLSKTEDVGTLYRRIRAGARSLCETEHSALWDVKRLLHTRQCFEQAVDGAVRRANQPALTALHFAQPTLVVGNHR